MPDAPVDPSPDPRFPNRPDSEAFRTLSRLVQAQDDDREPDDFLTQEETDAIVYIGRNRCRLTLSHDLAGFMSTETLATALYMDAFILGMQYVKEQT